MFLLRSCTDSFFANRDRPCLLYQIRRCSAPCVGRISDDNYGELVKDAKNFLSGKSTIVQQKLSAQMEGASEDLDFEMAVVYRDRLKALTFIQGSQAIVAQGVSDADVFALASKAGTVGIQAFFIRGGQNWGHRSFFPAHVKDVPDEEALQAFLMQFYEEVPPPKLVLVDRELPEAKLLAEALAGRANRKVMIKIPQRGDQRKLLDQARRNAGEALERRLAESSSQAKVMRQMTELFELGDTPDRIEIYDNSHVSGTNAVGAMVVAGPEGYRKSNYRKFNIKNPDIAPGDDFAMMREVFERRFARAEKEDPERRKGEWPDLVLIDGGRGQVSAAAETLEEMGISNVALIGISKGPDRDAGREHFHFPDGRERMLPANSPLLFYLQRLRDEAHRFVIGAHRQKRAKAMGTSPLDQVPGIGPARKRALLLHFGTARAVKSAGFDDLARVPGVSKAMAQTIYDHFHASG